MANHGGQLAGEATTVVAMLAKQCKAAEVRTLPLLCLHVHVRARVRL